MRNPEALGPVTLPNRKCSYQSVEEERKARQEALEAQDKCLASAPTQYPGEVLPDRGSPPPAEHQA